MEKQTSENESKNNKQIRKWFFPIIPLVIFILKNDIVFNDIVFIDTINAFQASFARSTNQ